jgi:regulator of sigma E protease
MELLWTIIQFIFVFGVLLLVHETGHFIMCRIAKVPVEEYGIGLPPRILTLFHWQGTAFTLNALPFGAFVRPLGEVDRAVDGGLANASPLKKLGVYFGGPVMNLLLGLILMVIMFYQMGVPVETKVLVVDVAPDSPALLSGIQSGDQIVTINGHVVENMSIMQTLIKEQVGKTIEITLLRDNKEVVITATPRVNPPEGQGSLGVTMTNPYEKISLWEAFPTAIKAAYEQMREFVLLPGRLISGTVSTEESRVVGIVGIYDMYSAAGEMDADTSSGTSQTAPIFRMYLMASISIAIGLTNLLPIPALDGGRILLTIPELILRKRIPQKVESYLISISFMALIVLMILITYNDIANPISLP